MEELKTHRNRCKLPASQAKRNILTALCAFVLFGLALSSCSNKNEGRDNSDLLNLTLPTRADGHDTTPISLNCADESDNPLSSTTPASTLDNSLSSIPTPTSPSSPERDLSDSSNPVFSTLTPTPPSGADADGDIRPKRVLSEEEERLMAEAMAEEKGLREVVANKLKEITEFSYDKNRNNLFLHIAASLDNIFPESKIVEIVTRVDDEHDEVTYQPTPLPDEDIDKTGTSIRDMYLERNNWTEDLGDCGYGGKEGGYKKLAASESYRDKAESLRADAEAYVCYVDRNRLKAIGGNKYFSADDLTKARDSFPLWNGQLIADMKKADRLWDELMVAVDNHCIALAKIMSLS
jgi:hypothetical protein